MLLNPALHSDSNEKVMSMHIAHDGGGMKDYNNKKMSKLNH